MEEEAWRLRNIEAIKQCKARYCYSVDARDWSGFASVFAPDAVWDISGCMIARHPETGEWNSIGSSFSLEELEEFSRAIQPVAGAEAIAAAGKAAMIGKSSFHKLFAPIIEFTAADQAKAIWPSEDHVHASDGPFVYMNGIGYYHETYEHLDGRWRIKTCNVSRIFLTIR
ncbi:SnoaL-like domain-containing protein [Sphingobium faniae]|nr:SnoaL-like domain-containing protein [Sphingobium faniae]